MVAQSNIAQAYAGARVYRRPVLAIYDQFVLGFSSSFIWQCPAQVISDWYNTYITGDHLDIGVGTGYFLDTCRFPTPAPRITLVDLNPSTLHAAGRRLNRYDPSACIANVLAPLPLHTERFDSIGLNYVLHCLPGTMETKGSIFAQLKPLLRPGGVLFGSTILGKGVKHTVGAHAFLHLYNQLKAFSNTDDSLTQLQRQLTSQFAESTVHVIGSVALFLARV
ncbi:MAG: class I SAM-dependent methyltransferase [Chloroflexota bacterium]|nr:class I SAM-dependent methyltransferase [Chloroflexota bacterium]